MRPVEVEDTNDDGTRKESGLTGFTIWVNNMMYMHADVANNQDPHSSETDTMLCTLTDCSCVIQRNNSAIDDRVKTIPNFKCSHSTKKVLRSLKLSAQTFTVQNGELKMY